MGFCGFWWVLVQIRCADDRGGRSGGKSVTATSESEAIDIVRALLNANINPALQTYEIDDPPSPS